MKQFKNVVVIVLVVVLFFGSMWACGWLDTHYTIEAKCIGYDDGLTLLEDTRGDIWEVYDSVPMGATVKILFDTMCTDRTIEDDEIIKVIVK